MTSPVNPFSQVTLIDPNITDPGNGGPDTLSIIFSGGGTLTDGADFAGTRTLSGSNGSYTLTGTAADINAELDALSFNGAPNTSFTLSDRSISTVVMSFNGADGALPKAGLISDAAGNLLGTTSGGGAIGNGTVFEIANIGTVIAPIYSSTPTTLVSFNNGHHGDLPLAGLTIDAAGNLLGTTASPVGTTGIGTLFEIANTGTVSAPIYSSTATTLASFTQSGANGADPIAGLISDAAGNLFGTTEGVSLGGATRFGTVFEIANTGSVSAPVYGTLTTLVLFNGADGATPKAGLISDAAGDLFGTTSAGGANGLGTLFELANTGSVSAPAYGSTPTTLWSFAGVGDGSVPVAGLVRDAAGDLFGTTRSGGLDNNHGGFGTVFEFANGTLRTLVAFDATNPSLGQPAAPEAGLIIDAAGDLFGTTVSGGANNLGTVFEVVNTGTVSAPTYNSFATTLWSFTAGADGAVPLASLTVDAAGDLFGTTSAGGTSGDGAVFELVKTDSGYTMAPSFTGTLAGQTTVSEAPVKPFSGVTISDPNNAGTGADTLSIMFSGGGTLSGTGLSGSNGSYTLTGTAAAITTELDALSFTPPVNGVPNTQVTTHFTLFDQGGATPDVLASFDYDNGAFPLGSLIIDAAGDLLGTTSQGGPGGSGTVFEIVNTGTLSAPVYSSTHTTLASFNGGDQPMAGLVRDAAGDLFGTRSFFDNTGSVFEIANTGSVSAPVYSSTPTTLVSFNGTDGGYPEAGLIVDAAGNLFGTTQYGGPGDHGTVFEIANTGSVSAPVYSSTPTTLWFFTGGADGEKPRGSLISDAAGDLFGTTYSGDGTVFELVNTGTISAPTYSALTTLASFNGDDGAGPIAGLMRDAAGDLLGTTIGGGPGGYGTVFELVNTGTVSAPSYGNTPATLVSFTGHDDGGFLYGGVISDAAGDLFGTTSIGGAGGDGTVFEVVNTGTVSAPVYSSTPTTLWAFTGGADGADPQGSLTIDAAGDLFGTASEGGISGTGVNAGTVFELVRTGSVYTFLSAIDTTTSVIDSDPAVAPTIAGTVAAQTTVSDAPVTPFSHVTITDLNNGGGDVDTLSITLSGGGTLSGTGLSGSNGSYTLTGTAAAITTELDALSFTPPVGVPNSSVTTTFTLSDASGAGTTSASDSVTTVLDHDPAVAPTITGTVAAQTTVSEAPVTPFSHVTITDANDGGTDTDTLSITLSGGGTLSGTGLSGSNGSYTLTGTATAITAELDALSFTPPVNSVPNTSVTTTFTLSDASGAGTTSASNSVTTVIDHDPAVAPTITGTVAGQTTTSETPINPFSHVTIADPNNGGTDTDTLSITLSGGGTLAGAGLSGSNGSYTLTGTAAAITAELDALSFTPVNGVPNTQVATTFTLSDASGAGTTSASDSVTTVIDHDPAAAPTITGTLAGQTTVSEAPLTPFSHVTIADFNNGATDTLSITLSGGGTLSGTGLSGSNGSYTLTGTAAAITTELDALSFTPVNGVPNASVTTTFTLSDASGAGSTSASNSVTTVIDHDPAVAPTITGTVAGQTTASEAPVTPFSHVTITDANDGGTDTDTLSITLSGGGTLSGTGLSGSNGSYTLTGTATAITTELDALSFTPVNGVPSTQVTTTFTLSDTSTAGTSASNSVTTVIDSDPPIVNSVTASSVGNISDLDAAKVVTITVNFSGPVNVAGTPELQLNDSEVATYTGGTGTSALTFSYTVQSTDNTADLQVQSLLLNGGTIKDGAGKDAALTNAPTDLHLQVDTIAPTVTVSGPSAQLTAGATPTVTFTFSESVPGFVLGDTTVSGGALSNLHHTGLVAGQDIYTATFTPTASNTEAGSVQVSAASYTDVAGNHGSASNAIVFTGDTLAPVATATASPSSGTETISDLVQITLAFAEAVTIGGTTPALALNDGGTATYDAAATAALHDPTKLVFDYTVQPSDATVSTLAITGVSAGSIADLAHNPAIVAASLSGLSVLTSLVTANADTNHVMAGQTASIDAAHGVLANDTDTNLTDHLVVSAVNGLSADVNQPIVGSFGSLTMHADGSYSYTANGAASGAGYDNFTYTADDGHGQTSISTLTVEVTSNNQNFVIVPAGGSATGGYGNTALDGSAGGATLTAATTFNAHQTLIGGPGDTLNAASYGQDTFVFANNFGHETLNNFHPALDTIQLQQSQFGSLANVMADLHQVGADSVLTLDASHIVTITDTQLASLAAANFHLV